MGGRNTMAICITKTIWLLSMVAYVISAPAGVYQQQSPLITSDSQVTVVSQTAPSSQYHAQDELGQYSYGYTNADGQSKAEVKGIDGSIAGKYSYIDANGKKVEVSYIADDNGFRAVGDHLPSHDMTAPQFLQQTSGSDKKESAKKDKEENGDKGKKTSGGSEEGGEEEEEGEGEEQEDEEEEEEEEGEGEEKEKEKEKEEGEEEGGEGEQEEEKESAKSPEVAVKKQQGQQPQQQLPVYTVQQPLTYAGQPTTLYRVSNVPMTIQTSSSTGQSRPQLVYVARAVHLAQPSISQYLQPTKSHVTNVLHRQQHQPQPQQQPLVNQYILATRTPLVSERQESAPKVAVIAATAASSKPAPIAPTFQLIQPAPIRADQHSFHTYVPALPSPQPFHVGKQKAKSGGKSHKAPTAMALVHQQHQAVPIVHQQQQQQAHQLVNHASQYFPQMALLPGYGYIPAQYSVFQ